MSNRLKPLTRAQKRKRERDKRLKRERCRLEEQAERDGYYKGYRDGEAAMTKLEIVEEPHVFLDRPASWRRVVAITPNAQRDADFQSLMHGDPIRPYLTMKQVTFRLKRKGIQIDGCTIEWPDWEVEHVSG